jgi:hypothetical protein
MKTTEKKPIPPRTGKETTAPNAVDGEELFVRLLRAALQGLLASNVYYDDAMGVAEEMYTPDEIVEKAWNYAERVTWDIEDRREVEERRRKNESLCRNDDAV